MINKVYQMSYLSLIWFLVIDSSTFVRCKNLVWIFLFIISTIGQLGAFIGLIKVISDGDNFRIAFVFPLLLLIFSVALYFSQVGLSKHSVKYEELWEGRFLERRERSSPNSRHMGTTVKNLNMAISRFLISIPLGIVLFIVSLKLAIVLILLIVVALFPLTIANKSANKNFQGMKQASVRRTDLSIEFGVVGEEMSKDDYYFKMLKNNTISKLIIDTLSSMMILTTLMFLSIGSVQISEAVIFLVVCRFLISNLNSLSSSLVSMNRLYSNFRDTVTSYQIKSENA